MTKKRTATVLALATAIAIPAEGLRQYAYHDPIGLLTVCWGSTTDVEQGKKYSLEECKARLDEDMLDAIETVERCVPSLTEPVLAAFSDAVFNAGPAIACDTNRSTAARFLKAGHFELACRQLPRWNKAKVGGVMVELPGLTKRRQKEMELCLKGVQ
jgi:lysozyme